MAITSAPRSYRRTMSDPTDRNSEPPGRIAQCASLGMDNHEEMIDAIVSEAELALEDLSLSIKVRPKTQATPKDPGVGKF